MDFKKILDKVKNGNNINKEECKFLLEIEEKSLESGILRATAAHMVRMKNDNSAIILGQIGVEVSPCTGGCDFCTFGEEHTDFKEQYLDYHTLEKQINDFCKYDDLYGLYLMTMHEYDLNNYLEIIKKARTIVSPTTQIWANVGDSNIDAYKEMKKNGITGLYHVCRIGEGKNTKLDPKDRQKSMKNALDAGLELYTCCEPIGPEHTPEELTENIFIGVDLGITQHAAMRRVAVPGSPLYKYGQISELRLAHIVAVISLVTINLPTMAYMGVHEPNTLSYLSGANIITAESGVNPRDNNVETSKNRGMDMAMSRKMLFECGFDYIRKGDESKIPLNLEYLKNTNSIL